MIKIYSFLKIYLVLLATLLAAIAVLAQETRQLSVGKPQAIADLRHAKGAALVNAKWFVQPAHIRTAEFQLPGPQKGGGDALALYPTGSYDFIQLFIDRIDLPYILPLLIDGQTILVEINDCISYPYIIIGKFADRAIDPKYMYDKLLSGLRIFCKYNPVAGIVTCDQTISTLAESICLFAIYPYFTVVIQHNFEYGSGSGSIEFANDRGNTELNFIPYKGEQTISLS